MDNQASKVIKKFLTPKQCELMLVEHNNHHVNAAEHAIQTFKDHLVSALATTASENPKAYLLPIYLFCRYSLFDYM
jgi:hypothetical protein